MASGGMTEEGRGYSAYGVLNVLLAHARWFVIVPLITGVLAGVLTLVFGRPWLAESTFAPQSRGGSTARLAALASQFGVAIPGMEETDASLDFYLRLAKSRVLLEEVALHDYAFAFTPQSADTARGNLLGLYEIEGDTEQQRLHAALGGLDETVEVSGDLNAGVITVRTYAPWAGLAVQINRALLDGIDGFNQKRRQSQAAAEREFLETRLMTARGELLTAENALSAFLESNRRYDDWPALRFQRDRLARQVDQSEQLVGSLVQAYEQARLQEVRNTPVIAVLDPPEGSARRDGSLIGNVVWGALAGAMLVLLLVFAREYATRERSANPADYEEFAARRRGLLRVGGDRSRKHA
ncbi:MAG: hypothetical protein ACREKM_04500 [Longimicrobiales bacterium]